MAKTSPELPILLFARPSDWADWLAHNQAAPGIWLRMAKAASGIPSINYAQALEIALCYGWIDSQKKSYDETSWLQRFTPRGPRSIWSRRNREMVEELIRAGKMQPAGLQAVEQARQNGRWEAAYDSQSQAELPGDLQAALDEHLAARAFFASLDSRNRYAILYRLQTARKAETRLRRLNQFIAMLEKGEKLYP